MMERAAPYAGVTSLAYGYVTPWVPVSYLAT